MKTSIARDIAATGIDAKYDTQCKVILGNKISKRLIFSR